MAIRFTREFLDRFDFKPVTRKALREFARGKGLTFADASLTEAKRGGPLPESDAAVILRFINHLSAVGYELTDIIEAAPEDDDDGTGEFDAKRGTFDRHLRYWLGRTKLGDVEFCQTEAQAVQASDMMMESLGYRASRWRGVDAINQAGMILKLTQEEQARFFASVWAVNPRAVCFALDPAGRRVGASIIYPVTEECYRSLRAGEREFFDVTAAEVEDKSDFILLHGLTENSSLDLRSGGQRRSLAQFRAVLTQTALGCHPCPQSSPRILTFIPDKEGRERADSYHFRDTGNLTPRTRMTLMEFAKPDEAMDDPSLFDTVHYWSMCTLLGFFQLAHRVAQKRSR